MSLTALDGTPLVEIGFPTRAGVLSIDSGTSATLDAANEACIMVGQIFTADGASHTINTTGSSALGWRANSVTFANAGTTVKVGLAAVDAGAGPPARAVNVADVITFDVSRLSTGGGGGITSAWLEHVPTSGSKTIANGDLVAFAVQMITRAGADSIQVTCQNYPLTMARPAVTDFTGGSYSNAQRLPNCVITFSDGVLGFFYGGHVISSRTGITYNSGSSPNEYGNFFQLPFSVKVYGLAIGMRFLGDTDLVLYSDPLGTPAAQKTVSVDFNTVGTNSDGSAACVLFASPYTTTANQPLAAIIKPTSGTSVTAYHKTFNASGHQASESLGANGYAVNRASGAFAAQNSNKDRFAIGLLVGAFDDGASVGGMPRSRLQLGH